MKHYITKISINISAFPLFKINNAIGNGGTMETHQLVNETNKNF